MLSIELPDLRARAASAIRMEEATVEKAGGFWSHRPVGRALPAGLKLPQLGLPTVKEALVMPAHGLDDRQTLDL